MGQISVRLDDERIEELDEEAEREGFGSRADLVRDAIESRNDPGEVQGELDELQQTLAELRSELDDLRTENDRLHRERRQLLEQREEHTDLVRFASEQQSMLERQESRRARPIWTRAFRWVVGEPVERT